MNSRRSPLGTHLSRVVRREPHLQRRYGLSLARSSLTIWERQENLAPKVLLWVSKPVWASIQILPVEFCVDVASLQHVLDILLGLLKRDVPSHVEAALQDPAIYLSLPRIVSCQGQPLVALVPVLQIAQVPGTHPDIGLRVPKVSAKAAPLGDKTSRLR